MPPSPLEHRRTHNILLISKLLAQRETSSPFTLLIDSLEQSSRPLRDEYIARAKKSNNRVIFVSYESIQRPQNVDIFLPCYIDRTEAVDTALRPYLASHANETRTLIVVDALNSLCSSGTGNLPTVLASLLRPNVSILAVFHGDVPILSSASGHYQPPQLGMLKFLATTIITVHCLRHVIDDAIANRDRKQSPRYGLQHGTAGIIVGEGAQSKDGLVLELEFRRKSGRGVREWYFMPYKTVSEEAAIAPAMTKGALKESIILLEDDPRYRTINDQNIAETEGEDHDVTFSMSLTERQRRAREDIVLPYFDAQNGGGEGGRILYDMTAEDDFDDEEDEI